MLIILVGKIILPPASLHLMQVTTSIDYKALYEQSKIEILTLRHELEELKKMIFGSKHERFIAINDTSQLSLDIQPEVITHCSVVDAKKISYIKTNTIVEQKPLQHPGRMKLPEHLRREEVIIEPAEDITSCRKMGEEITEVLEYEPGELFVKKYIRLKYAKPAGDGVMIGELPSRPIEKAMAGPGLLAQIVIDKYADHLPLYRQMGRFERGGVKLPYSTLTNWVRATCQLITPLYEALKSEVLGSDYLHADETPIKVLDKDKKGQTHRGYYWVYHNSLKKIVFFDYQQGRGREGPMGVMENFKGYLQTDGYVAYDVFEKPGDITLLHCMAHARRKFNEALDNDKDRSTYTLKQMQQLYHIERNCKEKEMTFEQIREVRQQQSVPILNELGKWMKQQYVQVLPKSIIGNALGYSIERWDKLCLYASDGMLNIDNNPVENSIRPVAIGRKNYLFCGSHQAAQRSAMLYSLLGTCKMHSIEPYTWLKNILDHIASYPINRIKELLPHNWCRQN